MFTSQQSSIHFNARKHLSNHITKSSSQLNTLSLHSKIYSKFQKTVEKYVHSCTQVKYFFLCKDWTSISEQPLWHDTVLVNKLVPCAYHKRDVSEMWSLWLHLTKMQKDTINFNISLAEGHGRKREEFLSNIRGQFNSSSCGLLLLFPFDGCPVRNNTVPWPKCRAHLGCLYRPPCLCGTRLGTLAGYAARPHDVSTKTKIDRMLLLPNNIQIHINCMATNSSRYDTEK